jgi:hypothetical protein
VIGSIFNRNQGKPLGIHHRIPSHPAWPLQG